jgi:hypothetical protein
MVDHPFASLTYAGSEQDRLAKVILAVQRWFADPISPLAEDWDEDLDHVVVSLATFGLDLGKAVKTLLQADNVSATGAVERTLYEIWCEVRELIEQGPIGAHKMLANSLIEMLDASTEEADQRWPDLYKRVLRELERLQPDAVAEVRQQREKRRFHWSGRTRTEVMRKGSPAGQVYMILSWEGHASHVAVRDALGIARRKDGERVYPTARAEYMDPEAVALRCSLYLIDLWDRYSDLIGVPGPVWPR